MQRLILQMIDYNFSPPSTVLVDANLREDQRQRQQQDYALQKVQHSRSNAFWRGKKGWL